MSSRQMNQAKLALTFNLQETNPLDGNLDMIDVYYELGVRHMLLAYNQKNRVGDGCAERTDSGLSRFGVRVIQEMNRVGMLVDGTHSGYKTTMEAMEVCSVPFIFSHCNAWQVVPHYRNIKDDQIKVETEFRIDGFFNGNSVFKKILRVDFGHYWK